MTNAILYIRSSDTKNADLQEAALRTFCDKQGFEVAGTFRDVGQPADGLRAARQAATSTPNAMLATTNHTRLGRDPKKVEEILDEVQVVTADASRSRA